MLLCYILFSILNSVNDTFEVTLKSYRLFPYVKESH